jgi:transcriptional regulator with XRE-family HTH domain
MILEQKRSATATAADGGINERIGRHVRELRASRGLTLDALAARCEVSRSMISLIERGEASPTAVVLEKLSEGLDVPLASLFATRPEGAAPQPLVRRSEQAIWRDPESGYLRRNLSPPGWPSPIHLVEVHFPAGTRVAYEVRRERPFHQQLWVLEGRMDIALGDTSHTLNAGDCLAFRLDRHLIFSNTSSRAARYVVVICDDDAMPASSHGAFE